MKINIRLIAVQIGDLLKYSTTLNEINRLGSSILKVNKENFPVDSITSSRATEIYNWMLSLAKSKNINSNDKIRRLVQFCIELASNDDNIQKEVLSVLEKNGCHYNLVYGNMLDEFLKRNFHYKVNSHAKKLFMEGNYFHAVFECAKAYNQDVKMKSESDKDGVSLMMDVLSLKGVLKLNKGVSDSEKNFQEGIKFLSSGLMQAIRNPTAHEPALNWIISKDDCLDILSFISFLYRKLDNAVYYTN